MKFGIVSDILGQRDDIPTIKLPEAYASGESEWMFYHQGAMRRLPGRRPEFLDGDGAPIPMPDSNPVLRWHYHLSASGAEFIHAFTKAHVYQWDGGDKEWDVLFTCGSDCTRWSTADFGPYIVATNNSDKVISWLDTTPATDYAVVGDETDGIDCGDGVYVTKAEHVLECEGYLFLMATTETGTSRHNRRRWCSWGDLSDWDSSSSKTGDAGWNDLTPGRKITGCGVSTAGGMRLVTFARDLIDVMWLTESDLVWESETLADRIGSVAPDSIVTDADGNLYYLAADNTIRVLGGGALSMDLDRTIRNLHPSLLRYTQAAYVAALGQLWWAVPSGPSSTGNDLALIFNVAAGTWHTAPMDIRAFGGWTGQTSYTIDGIPFPSIDGIEWPYIDWAGQVSQYPFLIASDYTGLAYRCVDAETDKGQAYSGRLVLGTDLAQRRALSEFKRVHGMWLWLEGEDGSVAVSIRPDGASGYEVVGSVAIPADGQAVWLPADARFRHCEIKFEASVPFGFVGVIFEYDWDGDA